MSELRTRLAAAWIRPLAHALRAPAVAGGSIAVALRLVPESVVAALAVVAAGALLAVRVVVPVRPHVGADIAAVAGTTAAAGGFLLGAPLIAAVERRHGPGWAAVGVLLATASVALRFRLPTGAATDAARSRRPSTSSALLQCRGIDFGYGGKVQVLHGVDFEVDEGELVALLGVNGAGKSTLLRAISGLGLPSSGEIRFAGNDITYLDAEHRLRLGINQVPGGRAVFGPLTVVDNLRAYAYSLDRLEVDPAVDRALEAFPRLDERRNQLASTLSGGEQQMLALAKAVMLRPRLLLIDELSLGLAPVVVGPLLDLVRHINAEGTAVVLVEQSVNIALNLARHAYFMERGEIRFDGPSDELLERGDLLRAVFLEGADAR